MKTKFRRRVEGKTDYQSRINLLKSGKPRIVVRKTARYIIGQIVESEGGKDKVLLGITSKNLLGFGWKKEEGGSLKSIPASYLAGYLLGKKALDTEKHSEILDIGLNRSIKGSRIYSFAKGLLDAGMKIKVKSELFPSEERINGKYVKAKIDIAKIKKEIEKKFG